MSDLRNKSVSVLIRFNAILIHFSLLFYFRFPHVNRYTLSTFSLNQTLSLSLSLSVCLSLTHTHSLSLSVCLSLTHTHSLSLSVSLSHTHILSLSLCLSLSHTHTHTHSLSLAVSLSHLHTHTCIPLVTKGLAKKNFCNYARIYLSCKEIASFKIQTL